MDNKDLKQKFINLRVNSVQIKEIVNILGIPEATAYRWNNQYSEAISNAKTEKNRLVDNYLITKIDKYLSFFENSFNVIEKELANVKSFPLNYEVGIDFSLKVYKTIQQLMMLKRSISAGIPNENINEVLISALSDIENDNNLNNNRSDANLVNTKFNSNFANDKNVNNLTSEKK